MNANKSLSIVIPVYNAMGRLRIFDVLLRQKGILEIICVDDGSTDGSPDAIREFGDPRIQIWEKEHEGAFKAWHFGVRKASGDFVLVMDCDDYVDEEYFETIFDFMERHEADALFVGSCVEKEEAGKSVVQKLSCEDGYYEGEKLEKLKSYLFSGLCGNTKGTKVIRREIYLDQISHTFTGEIKDFEDWLTMMEIYGKLRNVYVVNRPFYHYVQYAESLSKSKSSYRGSYHDALTMMDYLRSHSTAALGEETLKSIQFYALRSVLLRCIKIRELDLAREIMRRKDFHDFLPKSSLVFSEKMLCKLRSAGLFYWCYRLKSLRQE